MVLAVIQVSCGYGTYVAAVMEKAMLCSCHPPVIQVIPMIIYASNKAGPTLCIMLCPRPARPLTCLCVQVVAGTIYASPMAVPKLNNSHQ